MRVKDIMSSPLVTVAPGTPLKQVARSLSEHRITGVPVVDGERLVGIVSESDLVRLEQETEEDYLRGRRWLRRIRDGARRRHRTAADVMTWPVETVEPGASVVGAAWRMTVRDVNRLVVSERGRPVGIVTRADLVRAFGRSDADVQREILEDVLPSLGVSPNDVHVAVENGEVVLEGSVEDELEACCLPHAVGAVVGVVDVSARLAPRHRYHAGAFESSGVGPADPVADAALRRRV
jgi:CBS domain-containing protein